MCSRHVLNITAGIIGIIGVALLVAGIVIGFSGAMDEVVRERIKENVQLKEGTEQFERWEELPFPLLFKIYVFNVTNPDGIIAGDRPIVKEIGPWVYRQYRNKVNITYVEEEDTLTYMQYLRFEFDEEESAFDEDEPITVLNMPMQGIFLTVEDGDPQTANAFWERVFNVDGYFLTVPANQFFFDGYDFCVRESINPAHNIFCNRVKEQITNSKTLTSDRDKITFALFSHKQNASDGEYKISAGNNDVSTLGEILSWQELAYLSTWEVGDSSCNRIRGRDSSIYPPHNNEKSNFDIFNTDICRIAKLQTIGTTVFAGIDGIMAIMTADEMKNTGDKYCYCVQATKDLDGELACLPDGFADMGTCLGSPAMASFPHMLWADEAYTSTIEGLEPNDEKHRSFVVLEPDTGTPLQGAKRIQFNMIIRPIEGIDITENLQPAIFPVIWVEEAFELPDDLIRKLKSQLYLLSTIGWSLIGVGIALIVAREGYFIYIWIRK